MNMKLKRISVAACLAVAMLLAGCSFLEPVPGSGRLVRAVYPVTGFTGIQVSQSFQVRVIPDPVCAVIITCDDNLLRHLVVVNNGTGTLRLALAPGFSYAGVTLIAEVHMPVLRVVDASGASTVRLDSGYASLQGLTIILSGASRCECPGISCGDLLVDISGASQLLSTGSAAAITMNVSGASRANVLDCTGAQARVSLSGASEAWVDVGARPVDLSASGASTFYYGGSPALLTRELSGGSRILRVR
jgi:hypothetical protein